MSCAASVGHTALPLLFWKAEAITHHEARARGASMFECVRKTINLLSLAFSHFGCSDDYDKGDVATCGL